ncbi:MAG TPA: Crp/Fnr family transcriptional regulator [Stellaceae bacterium]|nr:Crp/Fnr family transcriptional regulator [Stellaceae bacterium]
MQRFRGEYQIANRLLLSLSPSTLRRLAPALEPMHMKRGQVIDHVDGPIKHLYFVNRGVVSLVKTMRDGRTVEIEAVGIEGITDPNAMFGAIDTAILESIVQIPGTAFRIDRDVLRRELERDVDLRLMMQRYAHFVINQIIQTAACNRLHSLEERCCRWLLTAHDSAMADSFPLTHEFLAMMLGVQRAGVSIAAKLLHNAGLIRYRRGEVTIADRAGLEEAACECYGVLRDQAMTLFRARKKQ